MTFRGLFTDKATRRFRVFTTLDSHVKIPVTRFENAATRLDRFETQYETGVAHRSWRLMARQFDPELRRADL